MRGLGCAPLHNLNNDKLGELADAYVSQLLTTLVLAHCFNREMTDIVADSSNKSDFVNVFDTINSRLDN